MLESLGGSLDFGSIVLLFDIFLKHYIATFDRFGTPSARYSSDLLRLMFKAIVRKQLPHRIALVDLKTPDPYRPLKDITLASLLRPN